jgi:hypothetical protein
MSHFVVLLEVRDPIGSWPKLVEWPVQAETARKARNVARKDYERRCAPKTVQRVLRVLTEETNSSQD